MNDSASGPSSAIPGQWLDAVLSGRAVASPPPRSSSSTPWLTASSQTTFQAEAANPSSPLLRSPPPRCNETSSRADLFFFFFSLLCFFCCRWLTLMTPELLLWWVSIRSQQIQLGLRPSQNRHKHCKLSLGGEQLRPFIYSRRKEEKEEKKTWRHLHYFNINFHLLFSTSSWSWFFWQFYLLAWIVLQYWCSAESLSKRIHKSIAT